jgi:hypothetical protein
MKAHTVGVCDIGGKAVALDDLAALVDSANAVLSHNSLPKVVCLFVNMKHPGPRWATDELAEPIKVALDQLHFRKIDLADEVVVVSDETGYVGESTRNEIAYAEKHGKPVRYVRIAATGSACDDTDLAKVARWRDTYHQLLLRIEALVEKAFDPEWLEAEDRGLVDAVELLVQQRDALRADMGIRQGALNDVLGRDRSQDSPTDYYDAVEDVAELKRALALTEERIAKTRQALRLDDKWSVQHGALAVRSERDRAVAELDALRAQLAAATAAPSAEERVELLRLINERGVDDLDAEELADDVTQLLRPDGPGCWAEDESPAPSSESVPATPESPAATGLWDLEAEVAGAIAGVDVSGGTYKDQAMAAIQVARRALLPGQPAVAVPSSVDRPEGETAPVVCGQVHDGEVCVERRVPETNGCWGHYGPGEDAASARWSVGEFALDRTNFVWRRDAEGMRPVRNTGGVAYSDESIEQAAGPLLRLLVVPEETDCLGAVPAEVADRLRAEAALEDEARAEAFDDVPHGDRNSDEVESLPEDFIGLVREVHKELTAPRAWIGPDPGADRALLIEAVRYVLESRNAMTTALQRRLRVGFAKAGRLTDLLEAWGIVSSRPVKETERVVLAPADAVEDIVAAISEAKR